MTIASLRRPLAVFFVVAAGAAASLLTAGAPAGADNGDNLILGQLNTATFTTYLETTGQTAFEGYALPSGGGYPGISGRGFTGVTGTAEGIGGFGVFGNANISGGTGVSGIGTSAGVHGQGAGFDFGGFSYGVYGSHAPIGVYGWGAIGVRAQGEGADSTGLLASPGSTENGLAIDAQGKVKLKESGKLTIPAGASQATRFDVRILPGSIVLVTIQQNRAGVFVQAAVPNVAGDKFTVFLNKPVPSSTVLAWVVLN